MDADKLKIYGAKVKTDSLLNVAEIETAEKNKMKSKCDEISSHGINCFINRQLIYDYPEQLLAQRGILSIEHADFEGVERLAKILDCEIASTFDNYKNTRIGYCKLIEEIMIGEDKAIRFSGVQKGEACTIVLRGASMHTLEEAERSLHDAFCVLVAAIKDPRFLLGGGNSEMQMAIEIEKTSTQIAGKKFLAIKSYGLALQKIPEIISENAGLDSSELIGSLHAEHSKKSNSQMGVDVMLGKIGNMMKLGIMETFKVKTQMILSATEAAECILRVDQVLTDTSKKQTKNGT
eukprot:gnl/TRDRNA2_/TRDRNA2_177429_c2_seq1.p1 gnl/TRDRNA2_/TRDRNA2_177429_c2~~gnl/TRDRNA2_/TRDRNA2_177429_c2_seq1.p1  ORF type:complete len:292 (-),score=11.50 gnl/TRDRNA2_/TRDRNA2_177429_c2_seq1:187-1062(-)